MRGEITPDNFCGDSLPHFDSASYHVWPFRISRRIADGEVLDLGGRALKILSTPGHTPDAISLLDSTAGYLWTGDSFYLGPIWLFMQGTDLDAYGKSIDRMAALAPSLSKVFPAHNLPVAGSASLVDAANLFKAIRNGDVKGMEKEGQAILFEGKGFSYLLGKDLLGK
jgi:glyoxylase-like metal-dependent hydrolase (beta-lactamase superfamily II)